MSEHRWAITTATGELLYGHAEPLDVTPGLSSGQSRIVVNTQPDQRTQKWNGSALVSKSANEIAEYDRVKADARLDQQIDGILSSVDGDVLTALLEQLKAMTDDVTAGKARPDLWKVRIKSRARTLRQAKGG